MEDLVRENVALWSLGLLLSGFLAGIATYKAILAIAHLKVISLSQWESIQSLMGRDTTAAAGSQQGTLSDDEQVLLRKLVAESKGIGDSVAVYPFQSNLRRLGMTQESASTAIASLQTRGFVALDEEASYDDLRERPSKYPVYRVTKDGFRWAIQNRG